MTTKRACTTDARQGPLPRTYDQLSVVASLMDRFTREENDALMVLQACDRADIKDLQAKVDWLTNELSQRNRVIADLTMQLTHAEEIVGHQETALNEMAHVIEFHDDQLETALPNRNHRHGIRRDALGIPQVTLETRTNGRFPRRTEPETIDLTAYETDGESSGEETEDDRELMDLLMEE